MKRCNIFGPRCINLNCIAPRSRCCRPLCRPAPCPPMPPCPPVTPCPPAPVILSPVSGSTDCSLTFASGIGTPGALLTFCILGNEMTEFCSTTTVNPDGSWQITVPPLSEGNYVFTASQQVEQCVSDTATVTYTESCQTCAFLFFIEPLAGCTVCLPVTQIVGTGPPNSGLEITISGPGGAINTTTTINEFLSWQVTIPPLTEPGNYTVTATSTTPPCIQTDEMTFTLIDCG